MWLTLVLFRPDWEDFRIFTGSLAKVADEFEHLAVLVSGMESDHLKAEAILNASLPSEKWSIIGRWDNLGFSGGHNLLLDTAFDRGASKVLVSNPDLEFAPGALNSLSARAAKEAGLHGPALARRAEGGELVVDSLGIYWSADGRHFDLGQGSTWSPEGRTQRRAGVTGACLLVTAEVYERVVAFDGEFFDDLFVAYREDAELGVRARALGLESWCHDVPGFVHRRSVVNGSRGSKLVNSLSVQNRFLMKWKLAGLRPGSRFRSSLRDVFVVFAVLVRERSSLAGLRRAYRVRRFYHYRGANLEWFQLQRQAGTKGADPHVS